MSIKSFIIKNLLKLTPSTETLSQAGELKADSADANRLKYHNGTVESTVLAVNGTLTPERVPQTNALGDLEMSAVTSAELANLSGTTSNIQTQIDSKGPAITGAASTIATTDLTIDRAVISNGSGKIAVSTVTSTELAHVSGVTSAIQTQLDAKSTESKTETLTNKTIDADLNTITNIENADIKSAAAIDLSKLAALTVDRALQSSATGEISVSAVTSTELGHVSGVISPIQTQLNTKIGASSTDSLTNKTIDADLNTITNIEDADIKSAANISLSKLAALTVSKAVVSNSSGVLTTSTTSDTEIGYVAGVTSAIQTQLDSKITASSTDTLSNKTLVSPIIDTAVMDGQAATPSNPAAGYYKMYVKDVDGKAYILDAAGVESKLGSGSGGAGGISYFDEIDLTAGTTGISVYDDSGTYVDGTGGSPSVISISANSVNALDSSNDLKISKSAASATGEGVTILSRELDRADAGRRLWVSFEWDGTAANYVENDIKLYAYDVTNAEQMVIIPVSNCSLDSVLSTAQLPKFKGKVLAYLYTKSTTTTIRLSFHVNSDSASAAAYDVYAARLKLGPDADALGDIISEPRNAGAISLSAVTTAPTKGTTTVDKVVWRRVGKYANITYRFNQTTSGANGSGDYLISLPAGLIADTSLISTETGPITTIANQAAIVGEGGARDGGSSQHWEAIMYNSTQFRVRRDVYFSVVDFWGSGAGGLGSQSSYGFTLEVWVPIASWSASAAISTTEIGLQAIQVSAYKNGGTSTANTTIASWTAKEIDTHNCFDATTGVFTAKKAGKYLVGFHSRTTAGTPVNHIRKNGTIVQLGVTSSSTLHYASALVSCVTGDTITFTLDSSLTFTSQNYETKFFIAEQPDLTVFSAILDNNDVEVYVDTGAGHGSTNTRIRRFSNVRKNTLGQYATYADSATLGASVTINIPGLYEVRYTDLYSAGAHVIGVSLNSTVLTTSIAAVTYAQGKRTYTSGGTNLPAFCTATIRCVAGDVIRPHTDGQHNGADQNNSFVVMRVGG